MQRSSGSCPQEGQDRRGGDRCSYAAGDAPASEPSRSWHAVHSTSLPGRTLCRALSVRLFWLQRDQRRVLGLVLLRGDEVISLTIEGPPPADTSRMKGQAAPAGPGMGRAAGRGLPAAAPGQAPIVRAAPLRIANLQAVLLQHRGSLHPRQQPLEVTHVHAECQASAFSGCQSAGARLSVVAVPAERCCWCLHGALREPAWLAQGLGAPTPGVGGPAPGMMLPRPQVSAAPIMRPAGPPLGKSPRPLCPACYLLPG